MITPFDNPASAGASAGPTPGDPVSPPRGAARHPCLVRMRAGDGASRPFFLVHSYGGTAMQFAPLAWAMPSGRSIYCLRPRGSRRGETPHVRVEDMAEDYLAAMRSVQPRGPYAVGGFSFGGLVALEIAQCIQRDGDTVDLLAMLDTTVDMRFLSWPDRLRSLQVTLDSCVRSVLNAEPGHRRAFLTSRLNRLGAYANRLRVRVGLEPVPPGGQRWWHSPALPSALRRVQDAIDLAGACYEPAPYAGRIIFIQAENGQPRQVYPASIWRRIARDGVEVHLSPGEHETMVQPQNVEGLAAILARYV